MPVTGGGGAAATFARYPLAEGVDLYVLPTQKFKTTALFVYLHLPLARETVTANALLPMVMTRGTERYPTTPELVRHLDSLYGASLGYDVARRGEVHSLLFRLELPAEAYLPGEQGLLERGIATLAQVIFHPATAGAGFKPDFVAQEKKNLKEMIEGLINDKRRYAINRCREILCEGEPFALYHLGRVEDLPAITPESLLAHWQQVLAQAAVHIYVVGDVDGDRVAELVRRHLAFPPGGDRRLPTTTVKRQAGPLKEVQEAQPVNQGVLVVGLRTGITAADPDYYALIVANGVLGAFPHSKLFINVREKNSLAYYAYSAVEAIKGVGFLYAGIEFTNYQKALDISLQQLRDLQEGRISDTEMDATIKALVTDALAGLDSPGRMVEEHLVGLISGRVATVAERIAGYQAVTKDQVAAAAQRFGVEAIYFLTREGT